MPDKDDQDARKRAHEDQREGKSPSTQAGEFVHEEMDHVRKGKHGARSTKQAIAIGLSKARRAGVRLKAPKRGTASAATRKKARQDSRRAQRKSSPSRTRSRATSKALRREGHSAASRAALSRQARSSAWRRSATARSLAAKKGARTRKRES
jgi:hypothetical protein